MSIYDAKMKQKNARLNAQLLLYPYSLTLGTYTPSESVDEARNKQKTARNNALTKF